MKKTSELLFYLLMGINFLAGAWGVLFFYGGQFAETNPFLWVFVPDCPLSALLVAAALLAAKLRKADWLVFLAMATALKYGFWTVFVLAHLQGFYLPADGLLLYALLFFGHVGLFLEAFLFCGRINYAHWYLVLALVLLTLNDFSDYVLGTHPMMPAGAEQLLFPLTLAMSFAACLYAAHAAKNYKQPVLDVFG